MGAFNKAYNDARKPTSLAAPADFGKAVPPKDRASAQDMFYRQEKMQAAGGAGFWGNLFKYMEKAYNLSAQAVSFGLLVGEETNPLYQGKGLDVNIVGTARMSAAAIPYLINSKYASIVNVSSTASINGFSELAVYSASKGAINSLTLAMAADCLRKGIRVNCVVPATTDTPWIDRFVQNSKDPQQFKKEIISVQPMQRLVTAYEVASAICYLASPVSASTHGTILNVDGGVTGVRF